MRLTSQKTVNVLAPLTVNLSAPSRAYVGVAVAIQASWGGLAPYYVEISWGDGEVDAYANYDLVGINASHAYSAPGSYGITVTVEDFTLNLGSASSTVQIVDPLAINLSASPSSGPPPLDVTFTAAISGGYPNYIWTLDFADGSTPASGTQTSTGTFNIPHTYTAAGTYVALLTVEDALGGATQLSTRVRIGDLAVPNYLWLLIPLSAVALYAAYKWI